jgi:secreted PhoX family phosphatase
MLKAGGAAIVALSPLPLLFARNQKPAALGSSARLVPDPNGVLDLPPGFRYRILERALAPMSDGYRVPARPDGMACFSDPSGALVLMRNHENDRVAELGAYSGPAPAHAFDAEAYGGVTRLVVDPHTLERVSSNLVLTGTMRNCAGGPSPWGWLSCEESVEEGHGYVFLCRSDAAELSRPERIVGYGRFNHEAVCIDPANNAAYLTEDRADGCLYRFLPTDRARPFTGKLQALRIPRAPRLEIGDLDTPGEKLAVDWVDLREPDSSDDSLRQQAQALGAAVVRRGEGIWFSDDSVYVCATIGGRGGIGQILKLLPERPGRGAALELVTSSPGEAVLDHPDNITVAPWGDVYMAEDGYGDQYVRALTPGGKIYDVARNAKSRTELAGVCFAPDGKTLFFNLQGDGLTVAVQGPFEQLGQG